MQGDFSVVVDPTLSADRSLSLLRLVTGDVTVTLTPLQHDRLGLGERPPLSESALRAAVAEAGITLHAADCVYYFSPAARDDLTAEPEPTATRRLTATDAAAFAAFEAAASEQDRDDAYVELDHWAVFGSFDGELLVSAASAYPWGGAKLADIGVLTLPPFRGRGHARRVVRALCRHAYAQDHEPQYRCQVDNDASRALALSVGLSLFGTWEVISPG